MRTKKKYIDMFNTYINWITAAGILLVPCFKHVRNYFAKSKRYLNDMFVFAYLISLDLSTICVSRLYYNIVVYLCTLSTRKLLFSKKNNLLPSQYYYLLQ